MKATKKGLLALLAVLIVSAVVVIAASAMEPAPTQEPDPPFVRVTYMCQAPEDGEVEEYAGGGVFETIAVEAGDHIWRIRHEDGAATAFSTNFLSDVQGFIEIDEVLFFATPQYANGVKVITTPLDNLYKGTASVSGKICEMIVTPVENLNLTFMQPCEPLEGEPEQAEWRVRNPNAFPVEYDVWKAGTGYILTDQVAPPGDSFFYTPWGAQTLKIEWLDENENLKSKTKAGGDSYNGQFCEEPQDDLQIDVDCEGWQVTFTPFRGEPEIYSGLWGPKDVLEKVDVFVEGMEETVTVYEPRECYECVPTKQVWVWTIFNPDGSVAGQLRDRGYDGTYDAPGLPMQRGYFGCDFYPGSVHGRYVDNCASEYEYWDELPCFNGFGGFCE